MRSSNDSSSSALAPGRSHRVAAAREGVVAFARTVALLGFVLTSSATARADSTGVEPPPAFDASPATFAELLEGFARTTGLEARFEEEKHLALLAVPLKSRGRLYFFPPATLLRRVEAPRAQEVLVVGDRVRIRDDAGEQTLDLGTRDEVRPLVESMLWILGGDLESLERTYHVDYARLESRREEGGPGARDEEAAEDAFWRVTLVPRNEPLSQIITALEVRGRGRVADTLELREEGGDRTITRIVDADPTRRFDATERRALFDLSDDGDAGGTAP